MTTPSRNNAKTLLKQVEQIINHARDLEKKFAPELDEICPDVTDSAKNLLHYMALRQVDFSEIQEQLAQLGLSRLAKAEAHVGASLNAVKHTLEVISKTKPTEGMQALDFETSRKRLDEHVNQLLGPAMGDRSTRIMVTVPGEAARDKAIIEELMERGVEVFRINCAHDTQEDWLQMIRHIKHSEKKFKRKVKVVMDLGGPKLRTGDTRKGPQMKAFKPRKDEFRKIIAPLPVWIYPQGDTPTKAEKFTFPVNREFFDVLMEGDVIRFFDTRNKKRRLVVKQVEERGAWAELAKTAYITAGTVLKLKGKKKKGFFGEVPPVEQALLLHENDMLVIHREPRPGEPAQTDGSGQVVEPAHISLSLPEILNDVRVGERIMLDDGKIEGVIESVSEDHMQVRITYAKANGTKLKSDKGINLPQSNLRISGLTEKDREDLAFVAEYADGVNLSFVNHREDIREVVALLEQHGNKDCGLILKIETEKAYRHLPGLLLEAMKWPKVGVMIARGDLAVEMDWKHLAEVQEEILWLCLAAHIPGIWATQVLESMAKSGKPSRAEITDAAMAQRADCVMLNKGPYIIEAVDMLDTILRNMQVRQVKKKPMLTKIEVSEPFRIPQEPEQ